MLTVQPFRNVQLYSANISKKNQQHENQKYTTALNQNIGLNHNYSQIMFQGARVDKTIQSFVERNKARMINTVSHYIDHNHIDPNENALNVHKAAFALLGLATSVVEIKDIFCSETNKNNGSYEPLFEDLKTPEEVNSREGIIHAINYFKDLKEPLFKNSKDDLTTYLVKKLFLETKTFDEINEDIKDDLNPDYKAYIDSKNKDKSDIITHNTLKLLGIRYERDYFNSLRYAREGYSDMVGKNISMALWDCFNNLSDEERTARSNKMREVAQQRWNSMTPDQKAEQISRMLTLQSTPQGELVRYVMYDAWNNCPEIIKGLYKFMIKTGGKETGMEYFDKEINSFQSQMLSKFWAENPRFAQKFGEAVSAGYHKFDKKKIPNEHARLTLQEKIEKERQVRIAEFENWKKQNGHIKRENIQNVSQVNMTNPVPVDNKTRCINNIKETFSQLMKDDSLIKEHVTDVQQWCLQNFTDEDYNVILRNCDTKEKLNDFIKLLLKFDDVKVTNKELLNLLMKIQFDKNFAKYRLSAYTATLVYKNPSDKQQEKIQELLNKMTKEALNTITDGEDKDYALDVIDATKLFFRNLNLCDTFTDQTFLFLNNAKENIQEAQYLPVFQKYSKTLNSFFDEIISKDLISDSYKKCKEKFSTNEIESIINNYYNDRTETEQNEIRDILKTLGKSLIMLYFSHIPITGEKKIYFADEARITLHKLLTSNPDFEILKTPILKNLYTLTEYMILKSGKETFSVLPEEYFNIYTKLIKSIDISKFHRYLDDGSKISIFVHYKNKLTKREREKLLIAKIALNKDLANCFKHYSYKNMTYNYDMEDTLAHYNNAMRRDSRHIGLRLSSKGDPKRVAELIAEYEEKFKKLHEEYGENIPIRAIVKVLNNENDIELDEKIELNIRRYMLDSNSEYFN